MPNPTNALTGPIRCVKQGTGKPIPVHPPVVEVLPPTVRETFEAPPELLLIAERFDRGDFRNCVEPIETLFFARRNTLHQGLLQYVVALMQLRMGFVRTPRRLLRQALELWSPYPEWQEGIDLQALRTHAADLMDRLPAGLDKTTSEEVAGWWIDPPHLSDTSGS